jgi:hypothetical protein
MRIAIKQMTASIENDHKIEMPSAAKERVAGLIKAN